MLTVYGNFPSSNILKASFNTISEREIKLYPLPELSPSRLHTILVQKNIRFEVGDLGINKFIYDKAIVGRFSGKVLNQRIVEELFHKYETDIIRMSVTIFINHLSRQFTVKRFFKLFKTWPDAYRECFKR